MTLRVMLTLDLRNASAEARSTFDTQMKQRHWSKLPSVTTTWSATFTPQSTAEGAAQVARNDVASSALAAGIVGYSAVCLPSTELTTSFGSPA